jgi:hypothetical protein
VCVLSRVLVAAVGLLVAVLTPMMPTRPAAATTPTAIAPDTRAQIKTAPADGIGYYDLSDRTLHLRNDATTTGSSNYAYPFGPTDPSVQITATEAELAFQVQTSGSPVVAGDWDGDDGRDGLAILIQGSGPMMWLFDDVHASGGSPDYSCRVGEVGFLGRTLVAGRWH